MTRAPASSASAPASSSAQSEARQRPTSGTPFRVALTGVRTFLGQRLIRELEADPRCEHIVALDVRPPVEPGTKTRFVRLDLTDPTADDQLAQVLASDGITTLVHAAFLAYPSHARSWAHELEAIGSLYVMNAAAQAKIKKFVLPSTTAVYGAHASNPAFLSEDHPLRGTPGSRWVSDRVAVERELVKLRKDCPSMITTSLRYCMTVGPTIRNFYTKMLAQPVVSTVMGYDPLVQFLHEDDAVGALLKAVVEDHPGVYNVVGDGTLYYSDVLRLGGKVSVPVPHFLGYPAATALFNVQLSVVPGRFLNFFRFSWVADGTRMHRDLGFTPTHSTREALASFYGATR